MHKNTKGALCVILLGIFLFFFWLFLFGKEAKAMC